MDVVIQRGKTVELEQLEPYSIAVDGFVAGPKADPEHHRFSFDHHEGCLRFATSAACMQAHDAILVGLDPERYTAYANDVDVDVCASIWCLKNPDRCEEPLVIKLIYAIGKQDMHSGAYPINGMSKVVEWISAPETDSKRNGDYHKISDTGLFSIMEAVLHRMDLYANGDAQIEISKQPKHGSYKVLRSENNWVLAESTDPHIYDKIYADGFNRIVLIRRQDDGSTAVSLAKRSDFVDNFPLTKMYMEFNKIEPGWGGSTSVGGAVRNPDGSRSHLPLEKIIEVVDSCVKK